MGTYSGVVLTGLSHDDGAENAAGVAELAYLLRYGDILTLQEATIGTTAASILTISATHVMKTGKAPIPVETIYEKSDFEAAMEGEVYSHMFNPKVTIFMAQPTIDNVGGFSSLKNSRLVLLMRRPGDTTNFYQVGSKFLPAKIMTGSVKFGKGPTGEPGVTFTIEAHNPQPFFYYTGTLPVAGA